LEGEIFTEDEIPKGKAKFLKGVGAKFLGHRHTGIVTITPPRAYK
jgi:hypothetical protein